MLAHVYFIMNKKNLKVYCGKTIDPEKRWERHLKGKGGAQRIRSAIVHHGPNAFEFRIVRSFDTEKEAYMYEAQLIATFALDDPRYGYNIAAGGRGPNRRSGFKQTSEWIEKRAARKRGILHTKIGIENLKAAGLKRRKTTPEQRSSIKESYRTGASMVQLANEHRLSIDTVKRICREGMPKRSHGGDRPKGQNVPFNERSASLQRELEHLDRARRAR